MYNFDTVISRQGTSALKYDFHQKYGKPQGVTPFWIADMDFQIAPEITAALERTTNHGMYGYTESGASYFAAVRDWFAQGFDYHIQGDWLVKTPGVVYALAMGIRAFSQPGDGVLIQKPLYYPIEQAIIANGRTLLDNTLVYQNGRYTIDFADFEAKAATAKIFILCNPHNPVGRVWTADELAEMGRICQKHGVIVISDEIHCDIIAPGHKHMVFSNICPQVPSIICTSPSKSFNLAGLQLSNIFIQRQDLRDLFVAEIGKTGYSQLNTMGIVACEAAYRHGRPWLEAANRYIFQNAATIKSLLAQKLPQAHVVDLEGTYLLWVDFHGLDIAHDQLEQILLNEVKVWFSSGTTFGHTGDGFFRINLACPRSLLEGIPFEHVRPLQPGQPLLPGQH